MELSTSLEIKNKSFTKKDIINISKLIYKEYQELDTENVKYSFFSFIVTCEDSTTYSQDNLEILEEGNILDLKKVNKIEITLTSFKDKIVKKINLILDLSEYEFEKSIFEISGEKRWATNIFEEMNIIINAVKPQETYLKDYKYLVIFFLSLSLGSLVLFISRLIFNGIDEILSNINLFGKSFIIFLLGIFSGGPSLYGKILKLYPSIEFDFGPEHFNIVKRKRKVLTFIIVTVGLSILSNILYSLIVI